MFAVLGICYFFVCLHRISPTVIARDLVHEFGANATDLGLMSSAYFHLHDDRFDLHSSAENLHRQSNLKPCGFGKKKVTDHFFNFLQLFSFIRRCSSLALA
jgi:hypothetical protein